MSALKDLLAECVEYLNRVVIDTAEVVKTNIQFCKLLQVPNTISHFADHQQPIVSAVAFCSREKLQEEEIILTCFGQSTRLIKACIDEEDHGYAPTVQAERSQ